MAVRAGRAATCHGSNGPAGQQSFTSSVSCRKRRRPDFARGSALGVQVLFPRSEDRAALMERHRSPVEGTGSDTASVFRIATRDGGPRRARSHVSRFEWAGRPAKLYFFSVMPEEAAA